MEQGLIVKYQRSKDTTNNLKFEMENGDDAVAALAGMGININKNLYVTTFGKKTDLCKAESVQVFIPSLGTLKENLTNISVALKMIERVVESGAEPMVKIEAIKGVVKLYKGDKDDS